MTNEPPITSPSGDSADWEAIARYFAGESGPDERAAVEQWLSEHPSEAAALGALGEATEGLVHAAPRNLDVDAALRRVTEHRRAADVIPISGRRPPLRGVAPRERWRTFGPRAAAAAVLLAAVGLFWHSARRGGYTPPSPSRTLVTAVGERDSLRLPDGTRVLVAPESRVIVAAGYGDRVREVELQGEGYFDVHHDDARPFVVRAGGAVIRDLGTTFTVRATASRDVRVVVTSGSVSLTTDQAGGDRAPVLRAGDIGSVSPDGRTIVQRGGADEADTAWTRGRLVFREAPVASVQDELHRWYGIDLRVDSAFAGRHLSMTFEGEAIDRVLQVIALSLGGEIQRRGDVVTITPARPSAR